MGNKLTIIKSETLNGTSDEVLNGIKNHNDIAKHYQDAANEHINAAKYREEGNQEQVWACMMRAHGHASLAYDMVKKEIRNHTINSYLR